MRQPVEHDGGDALGVVGGMVGLEPGREPAFQPDGVAKRRDDPALARHRDQILVAHQFADGGGHFRRQARRQRGQGGGVDLIGQEMVAQFANGHRRDRRESVAVMAVDDQPRHLVGFIGNQRFLQESLQRQIGQDEARGDPRGVGGGGDPGQLVAGPARRRRRQQRFQIVENEIFAPQSPE